MFDNQNSFNDNSHSRVTKVVTYTGFQQFTTNLEKYFFSQVTLRENSSNDGKINLIIELDCDLTLTEMIFHFNKGNWGTYNQSAFSFADEIYALSDEINNEVDIDEFSLFLKDTSIIINKIYTQSIPDQLENILIEICRNHTSITKGMTEVPFEVYIPVFEESPIEGDSVTNKIQTGNNKRNDYFDFWGLYFESDNDDAIIYELGQSFVHDADLFMLND